MQNAHARGSVVSVQWKGEQGRRGSLAFIWHLYRLSIPIVRNYPVRRGRLVKSALRVGWLCGGCGRAGKLQVLLALVFVILPPSRCLSHSACS